MALTKNDINLLKEGLKDTFATKEDIHGMKNDLLQAMEDKSRITTNLLRSEIKASENRVKKEIISEVTEFIGNHLIPQLDSHEQRITKLEIARV